MGFENFYVDDFSVSGIDISMGSFFVVFIL